MIRSRYINKLINIPQSDHITELNNPDHINKLIDISWSDYMTIQNENPEDEMLFMDSKFVLIRSCPRTTRPYQSCYSCMFHHYHNKSL